MWMGGTRDRYFGDEKEHESWFESRYDPREKGRTLSGLILDENDEIYDSSRPKESVTR